MTIRYTCEKCGSVLKIKEDRAGKEGHCPKCKSAFIVPTAETPSTEEQAAEPQSKDSAAAADSQAATAKPESAAPAAKREPSASAAAAPAIEDEDFDPVAFLMTDGPAKSESPVGKQAAAAAGAAPDMRVKRGGRSSEYSASDEPDVRVGGSRTASTEEDDEEVESKLRNRRPKRPAAPPSASQSADEMLRVNAATSAKDLMTKTVEESRIRAAQMPETPQKPGIDYKEAARELGLRFAPATVGFVLLVMLAYWFGNHLAGGGLNLPDLGRVSGTVTKKGQPMVDAHVVFTPVDAKAGAATAYTDENGYYELNYTEGVKGAVLGKNKVEVSLIGKNGREVVRPLTPYGIGSTNIETVAEGSQTINIEIP